MKINKFRGDLRDISAKTATLTQPKGLVILSVQDDQSFARG